MSGQTTGFLKKGNTATSASVGSQITDHVEFHEKGRRHQENVKKRLKNITKNSFKAQKELEKEDVTVKQMEKAALDAYKRDIENNADISSAALNKKLKDENLQINDKNVKIWHQLKSKEGDLYYWNTVTNETSWETPTEGFLNLQEQREESFLKTKKELETAEKEMKKKGLLRSQQLKKEEEEERARIAREKLKERRVVDLPVEQSGPIIEPGNPSPYGRWETIKETPLVDFQLPEQEYYEPPIVYEQEPIMKEFKEKKVESLENEAGEATFKKRKTNFGNRKNVRQRLED